MKNNVGAAIRWALSAQILSFIFQFASTILLARLLSPQQFGIAAFATTIVGIACLFQTLNSGTLLIKEASITDVDIRCVFSVNFAFAAIAFAVIVILAKPIENITGIEGVFVGMLILACNPFLTVMELVPTSLLERHLWYKKIAILGLLKTIVGSFIALGAAINGLGFKSILIGSIASRTIYIVGLHIASSTLMPSYKFSFSRYRWVLEFGILNLRVSGVSELCKRFSEIIITKYLGVEALGLYDRAQSAIRLIWDNVYLVGARVLFNSLSKQKRESQGLGATYSKILSIATGVFLPIFGAGALLSYAIINTLYGSSWAPSAPIFSILCISCFLLALVPLAWDFILLHGGLKEQASFEVKKSLIGFIFFSVGAYFSVEWAAAAFVLQSLIGLNYYLPRLIRAANMPVRQYSIALGSSLFLTIAALSPSLLYVFLVGWSKLSSIFELTFLCAGGFILWLAAGAALNHPCYLEIRRFVKRAWAS
jgi:O-antigen/teichoic acid export membrane protein